ncbi:hypothetical protein [Hippea sp. KM1]|uniref:hypothetical protein n=1 Tax=Hippea sp. KM1 TaxID=944481 RepID=UPI00046CB4E5|nr:hypothetical protein [Hippea sp. KM1]
MLREFLYLAVGATKRLDRMVEGIIEEGKREMEDKGLIEISKEHLNKRKEQLRSVIGEDIKKLADEFGFATKEDIEELKRLIKTQK